jgi:uncharacterized membrane protein
MSKFKYIIELFSKNTLAQISALGAIMIISAILSNYYDWSYYVMIGSILLLALIALMYIVAAWIVNPIKYLIDKRRKRKLNGDKK